MSLETWKAEFYTQEAKDVPKAKATAHCLRKWRGLLPENAKKHGLHTVAGGIWTEKGLDLFQIDSRSCALCYQHMRHLAMRVVCSGCPLQKVLGKKCHGEVGTPYALWIHENNPKPMIAALEVTLEAEEKQRHDPS